MTPESIAECRDHFGAYFLAQNPTYGYFKWQQEIVAPALDLIIAGEIDRLVVEVPFQQGKSEFVTCNFAAHYLGHFPNRKVMSLSYNSIVAEAFGTKVRDLMSTDTHQEIFPNSILRPDSRARRVFRTQQGGIYYADGFDGTVNSRGGDLILIDDPCKNKQEVLSEAVQKHHRELYKLIRTRLQPRGAIIFVTTPWHPADLLGWRLQKDGAVDLVRGGLFNYERPLKEAT